MPPKRTPRANAGGTPLRSPPVVAKECFLFKKGSCRFGEGCKFLHASGIPAGAGISNVSTGFLASIGIECSRWTRRTILTISAKSTHWPIRWQAHRNKSFLSLSSSRILSHKSPSMLASPAPQLHPHHYTSPRGARRNQKEVRGPRSRVLPGREETAPLATNAVTVTSYLWVSYPLRTFYLFIRHIRR